MSQSVLFRSESMSRCQLILQSEAAYNCISELGELGLVQFVDLNPDVSAFQRKFVGEVMRCEEMERKLRYIQREAIRDSIQIHEPDDNPPAPAPREMAELETALSNLERDLNDVNTNYVALRKNHLELLELKNLLSKTEAFLSESSFQLADPSGAGPGGEEARHTDDAQLIDVSVGGEEHASMKFNITAGVIERAKVAGFERMLWRVTKGNVFVRFADIDEPMEDPKTGSLLQKVVFMVFFQGEALKVRVKKICEGFHATTFPCPERASERREMMFGVNTRLEDLTTVLKQTEDHRRRLIMTGAKNLRAWYTKVRKIKAIYHCLNLFSFDVTQKALVAECWLPENDIPVIQEAMRRGADLSGSTIPPILNTVATMEKAPTFNRLNKYTLAFQNLVDAYGVPAYREVNPTVYTIATFPFLFGVMFGDTGHGIILLVAGLLMIWKEERLSKSNIGEIFAMFFSGRYVIALMGLFSMYTGLIYNDFFSKSINLFGSRWTYRDHFTFPIDLGKSTMLDPGNFTQYQGTPYYLGMDPGWQDATNKIQFLNTYKMKVSLIFGLFHMTFGLFLNLWNKLINRSYMDIILEFIPQLVFLTFIFIYLLFLIFFKWIFYFADTANKDTNIYSEHCAPNLLISFINMMLFKPATPDKRLEAVCHGKESYMYPFQETVQHVLVIVGVIMVPIMLFGKPIYTLMGRRQRRRHYIPMNDQHHAGDDHDEILGEGSSASAESAPAAANGAARPAPAAPAHEEPEAEMPFSEILLYSGIHTIEFTLSCVSHTASYLRLWALSLAHAQLSEVLWTMVLRMGFTAAKGYAGVGPLFLLFGAWSCLTVAILVLMEGLSAFLHTLRLHWVEFQNKFYNLHTEGVAFVPFSFKVSLKDAEAADEEMLKAPA